MIKHFYEPTLLHVGKEMGVALLVAITEKQFFFLSRLRLDNFIVCCSGLFGKFKDANMPVQAVILLAEQLSCLFDL